MRVLVVIHYPVFGGPHNQALLLARAFERRGVEMTVLVPDGPGSAAPRLRAADIDVVTIPLHRLRASLNPARQLPLIAGFWPEVRALRHVIRDRNVDLVQIGGLVNPHAAIAARLESVAVVWQLLDTRAPMGLRRLLMPLVLRLSDVVMTTGRRVASVHPGAEALGERLHVFYPPVDPDAFDPKRVDAESARAEFGFAPADLVIGTVGNLNPQKGYEYLIRAAARVRKGRAEAKLLVVGASHDTHRAYERGLYHLCDELGLVVGRDVIFAGPRNDVRPALAAMDIFALASVPRSEGAPTAVEEALTIGVPVVATDVGAVAELVDEGETGYLVPPLDAEAMAERLEQLLSDSDERARMGARAPRRARHRFSLEECAEVHLAAYELALSRRGSPGLGR
jgi:glycosyltransferase involved in cell wall biosynthesis